MDRLTAQCQRDAARYCRQANPFLRASQLDLLLTIALKEGQTLTELGEDCDLSISAVSRALDVLGKAGRRDGKSSSYGWVEGRRNPDDDRILQLYLTPKGRHLIDTYLKLCTGQQ
jgi:DNA-binding MarR family transcriptional regulator